MTELSTPSPHTRGACEISDCLAELQLSAGIRFSNCARVGRYPGITQLLAGKST